MEDYRIRDPRSDEKHRIGADRTYPETDRPIYNTILGSLELMFIINC